MTGAYATWGPLVALTDVDEAIIAALDRWLNTYLGQLEAERQLADGFLPRPTLGSYTNALTSLEFLDHALPAIVVTTAQTVGTIARAAGGDHLPWFQAVVSCVVRGSTPKQTRYNAAFFEASTRRALVQKATKGPTIITDCLWTGSSVEKVADTSGSGRYLAAGISRFDIAVDSAVRGQVGPWVPDGTPYADPPLVADLVIDDLQTLTTGVSP